MGSTRESGGGCTERRPSSWKQGQWLASPAGCRDTSRLVARSSARPYVRHTSAWAHGLECAAGAPSSTQCPPPARHPTTVARQKVPFPPPVPFLPRHFVTSIHTSTAAAACPRASRALLLSCLVRECAASPFTVVSCRCTGRGRSGHSRHLGTSSRRGGTSSNDRAARVTGDPATGRSEEAPPPPCPESASANAPSRP